MVVFLELTLLGQRESNRRRPGPQTQDHSDCILTANAVQDCPSASTVADSEGETEQCHDLRRDSTPRRARSTGDEDRPRAPWTSLSRALTASAQRLDGPACPSPG